MKSVKQSKCIGGGYTAAQRKSVRGLACDSMRDITVQVRSRPCAVYVIARRRRGGEQEEGGTIQHWLVVDVFATCQSPQMPKRGGG